MEHPYRAISEVSCHCIGCGIPRDNTAAACPECDTPGSGHQFEETVLVTESEPARIPDLCCCCLAHADVTTRVDAWSSMNTVVSVAVPWCRACEQYSTRKMLQWLAWSAGAVVLLEGAVGIVWELVTVMPMFCFIAAFAGGVALGTKIANAREDQSERVGHVPSCAAVIAPRPTTQKPGERLPAPLVFRNRAFAERWREMNRKRELDADPVAEGSQSA